jgi:hypothetical protein
MAMTASVPDASLAIDLVVDSSALMAWRGFSGSEWPSPGWL